MSQSDQEKSSKSAGKRFRISSVLYQESFDIARGNVGIPLTRYSKRAILLLGYVSQQGYNTTETKLITEDGPVSLPRLATPQDKQHFIKKDLVTHLDENELAAFEQLAESAGITRDERASRALRFANFLVVQHAFESPIFQHKGLRPVQVLGPLY